MITLEEKLLRAASQLLVRADREKRSIMNSWENHDYSNAEHVVKHYEGLLESNVSKLKQEAELLRSLVSGEYFESNWIDLSEEAK